MIVSEYALSPCIFDVNCYSSSDVCYARLQMLKDILLYEEALIRNLYNGKWLQYVKDWLSGNRGVKCYY